MNALSGRAVDENETHRQKDRQTDRQAKKRVTLGDCRKKYKQEGKRKLLPLN